MRSSKLRPELPKQGGKCCDFKLCDPRKPLGFRRKGGVKSHIPFHRR